MENYLKDSQCQSSNNFAENAIHLFTVGRKNRLFWDIVEGAKASAVIYSIVETAKANNLSVKDYLRVLLEILPEWDVRQHPENMNALLLWGEYIQDRFEQGNCRILSFSTPPFLSRTPGYWAVTFLWLRAFILYAEDFSNGLPIGAQATGFLSTLPNLQAIHTRSYRQFVPTEIQVCFIILLYVPLPITK